MQQLLSHREWLKARIQLAKRRLDELKNDRTPSAAYERSMHEKDVEVLSDRLKKVEANHARV